MLVYHLTAAKYALESIETRRLKLALLNDMNDPFELMAIEGKTKDDRAFFRRLKSELHEEIGIVCFSRRWKNPVLWSHYADRHHGIALGFELPDKHVLPVDYTRYRIRAEEEHVEPLPGVKDIGTRLLTTKFSHWRYEEEVRVVVELASAHKEDRLYFTSFDSFFALREVVIGAHCDLKLATVKDALGNQFPDVNVVKARLAFKSFAVVRDRRKAVA